ncbi:hypothetical protein MW887_007192 [Aspergillus wentii]|nr:hypothetical protein MW887_007192 [Aspergillus wentii]
MPAKRMKMTFKSKMQSIFSVPKSVPVSLVVGKGSEETLVPDKAPNVTVTVKEVEDSEPSYHYNGTFTETSALDLVAEGGTIGLLHRVNNALLPAAVDQHHLDKRQLFWLFWLSLSLVTV